MEKKTTPARGQTKAEPARPAARVINLNDVRMQRLLEHGLAKPYAPGAEIQIKPNSTYVVGSGEVKVFLKITTKEGPVRKLIRTLGENELFALGGLLGRSSSLPNTIYVSVGDSNIIELPRAKIRERDEAYELLKVLLRSSIIQGEENDQTLALFLTKEVCERSAAEAALERRLETSEREADIARTISEGLTEELVTTQSNLSSVTRTLQKAEETIETLKAQVLQLIAERNDAVQATTDIRQQMHDAFETFEAERQHLANFWQRFEAFMHKGGIDHLPPELSSLLLGFPEVAIDHALESLDVNTVIDLDEDVIIDLEDLVVAEEVDSSNQLLPRASVTAAYPIFEPMPMPAAGGSTTIPDAPPRTERSTLMGLIPADAVRRAAAAFSREEMQRALEATALDEEDPFSDAEVEDARGPAPRIPQTLAFERKPPKR